MLETQRLKDLHDLIDKMVEEELDASGTSAGCKKVDNLISIYRDIIAIDEAVDQEVQERIRKIIHFAYVVNGSADILQTEPNKYQVSFIGNFKDESGKRDILRIDLEVHGRSIKFAGYELL